MQDGDDSKKAHVREAFNQFAEATFQRRVGLLSNNQLHEALLRFYISEVHNRLNSPIDEDDFSEGFVNAGHDLGIDFIHKNDETVLILQSKFKGQKSLVEQPEILHFQTIFDRIGKASFKKNQKLADALSDIDFKTDRFICKFISLGRIAGQAEVQTKQDFTPPQQAERTEFEFFGEDDLTRELRNALSLSSGTTGVCELFAAGKRSGRFPIIELTEATTGSEGRCSVVLVVGAPQLVALFDKYKSALFTLNIRNYLGNTATNKSITETLKNESENFYYYNNGIAGLADDFTVQGDKVTITNIQIINGAQTVRSLHKASKNKELHEAVKRALVLVRVTKSRGGYGEAGRFRTSIVRSNNTQNVIKLSDFKSNEPVQADLKAKFKQFRRNGKEIAYVSKRTDPQEFRTKIPIQMEEFAKVIYSFLGDPVGFSAKTSFLFDDSEAGGYLTVFGDGKEAFTVMPEADFRLRSSLWWIADEFTERLKTDRTAAADQIERMALERKWMLFFVSRLVLERSFKGASYQAELAKHYRGDWSLGQEKIGRWMQDLYDVSKEALVFKYSEDTTRPQFNHRNWMRSADTVASLREYVRRAPRVEVSAGP